MFFRSIKYSEIIYIYIYIYTISLIILTYLHVADLCLTLPCGVNALCDATDGQVKCSCSQTMVGDPEVKCEGKHLNSSVKCELVNV